MVVFGNPWLQTGALSAHRRSERALREAGSDGCFRRSRNPQGSLAGFLARKSGCLEAFSASFGAESASAGASSATDGEKMRRAWRFPDCLPMKKVPSLTLSAASMTRKVPVPALLPSSLALFILEAVSIRHSVGALQASGSAGSGGSDAFFASDGTKSAGVAAFFLIVAAIFPVVGAGHPGVSPFFVTRGDGGSCVAGSWAAQAARGRFVDVVGPRCG